MDITPIGYAFLGLTVIVAMLVGVLMFAALRFAAAARDTRRHLGDSRAESMLLASALEDAFVKLKAQERATAARAEASERLSSEIVSSLTSGLIVVDSSARVQIVNPAARRILGLDDASYDDVSLDTVLALRNVVTESLRTGLPVLRRPITLDGPNPPMHLGVTVSPLVAGSGMGGAICLFTDLTSVVALEEQLRFKETLARLGELTAGLAHEFRNGLATIHGYARLLDPGLLPEPQRPYLQGIRDETHSLGNIVTNFLKFAKPDPLTFTPVDLSSLIRRAADDVPRARVMMGGEFPTVEADEVLLRQAVSNLFRNSLEACTTADAACEIHVNGQIDKQGENVVLSISDNGPGIQRDALPRLFHPFFTTRPGGTGLGLAIVQKIVVSHNGLITAANRSQGGAVFTIMLPTRPPRSAAEI